MILMTTQTNPNKNKFLFHYVDRLGESKDYIECESCKNESLQALPLRDNESVSVADSDLSCDNCGII